MKNEKRLPMRKIIALLLVCCVLFGLAACGQTTPASDAPQTTEAPQASAAPEPTEPSHLPLPNGMNSDPADYDSAVPTVEEMAAQVGDKFTQELFEDSATGLALD